MKRLGGRRPANPDRRFMRSSSIGRICLLVVGVWTAVAILFAGQEYAAGRSTGRAPSWWTIFGQTGTFDVVWAILTFGLIAAVVRYPPGRGRTLWFIVGHLPLGLVAAVLQLAVYRALLAEIGHGPAPPLLAMIAAGWHINLLIYWIIVGVTVGVLTQNRLAERELAALRLEKSLGDTRSAALRAQLQPHFLFNTLNAISALIRDEPRTAERMIARLGDLLRLSLDRGGAVEVSLAEDLAATETYLEIEKLRMGDRLRVERAVAPETLEARVPDLLLQPLIENAVRHGLSPMAAGGTIHLSTWRVADRLIIEVADDGRGLPAESGAEGIGLANTRERIAHFSQGAPGCGVTLAAWPGGGCSVTLRLPWRAAE